MINEPGGGEAGEPTDAKETTDDAQEAQRMAMRALRRAQSSGSKADARAASRGGSGSRRRRGSSRDPQEVGSVMEELIAEQGWESTSALAALTGAWAQVVGPEVAEHVQVESIQDGQLTLVADSTAWATQVRLLTATLLAQVQQAVGEDAVRSVSVRGPQAPSWRSGPRVVKGRGPRDTYG